MSLKVEIQFIEIYFGIQKGSKHKFLIIINNDWLKWTAKMILRIDADSKNLLEDEIPSNTYNPYKRKDVFMKYICQKGAISKIHWKATKILFATRHVFCIKYDFSYMNTGISD